MRSNRLMIPLAAAIAGACLGAAPAPAPATAPTPASGQGRPMHLIWSTFMRNYPSEHAMVIDEIAHDRVVYVLGCNDQHWCEVVYGRAAGYIEAAALEGNIGVTSLRGPLNPDAGCFWINTPAYIGMRAEELCGVTHNQPSLP